MEWISVDDRIPPQDKMVLVCTTSYDKNGNDPSESIWLAVRIGHEWLDPKDEKTPVCEKRSRVTHWMFLPDVPKLMDKVLYKEDNK